MKDIMRCLKRAIAREMYQELTRPTGFTTAGESTPESGPSGVDNL